MSVKQGDVVELNSGSQEMTVNRWIPSSDNIEVCWFDYKDNSVKTQILHHSTVKPVTPSNSDY